jgi:hypothetical protein
VGDSQDLIFLFRIPMGHRKNFFKIYREFGHVPSNSLPALTEYHHDLTALLKYTDIKAQKDMVLIVYSVLIQYYIFHNAPLASFLILIIFFITSMLKHAACGADRKYYGIVIV